jgi:hypothetical protein
MLLPELPSSIGLNESVAYLPIDVQMQIVGLYSYVPIITTTSRDRLRFCLTSHSGLPPLKWSSLRYGFGPFGGRIDDEEAAHG